MSQPEFGTVEWALDQPICSPGAKLVLVLLARDGGVSGVRPEVKALAKQAGISPASVGRHLAFLIERGWVRRTGSKHHPLGFVLCAPAQLCTRDENVVERRFLAPSDHENSGILTAQ